MSDSMNLPKGKTCGDCAYLAHCVALGFTHSLAVRCDFHPSRFRESPAVKSGLGLCSYCGAPIGSSHCQGSHP